jgi:ribosomal protein L37AE/L43A
MWTRNSENVNSEFCWYTVNYCPRCKKQRVWNTKNEKMFLWKCSYCDLIMKYYKGRMHLT